MSIYDRDYYREEPPRNGRRFGSGLSGVAIIILLNVGLYLLDQASGGALFRRMALSGAAVSNPLQWYRCLTYGFAHDPTGFMHILCNMLVLFFFGPHLERLYGKLEFSLFYVLSIIFGGIVWNVLNVGANAGALGASGGVTAVVILFAMNFPKTQILLYGIIPLPAWLAGVLYVVYDAFGARHSFDNVAHDIHLAGAVFAFLYFVSKIRFVSFFSDKGEGSKTREERSFSVINDDYDFDEKSKKSVKTSFGFRFTTDGKSFDKLEEEVDRILRKIHQTGETSLTQDERETLRLASREYQKRQK